jgi:hypothetical protein
MYFAKQVIIKQEDRALESTLGSHLVTQLDGICDRDKQQALAVMSPRPACRDPIKLLVIAACACRVLKACASDQKV